MTKLTHQLTDVELEMMTIIWTIEPCTVHEVMDLLPKDRPLAYTSVSTIMRILEQKKILKSEKEGRGHRYYAAVSQRDYETLAVSQVVKNVFQGEPKQLVKALLSVKGLTIQDLDDIQKMIADRMP